MNAEPAKIRLKIGQLEVEYEGPPSFLEDGLLNMMTKIVGFYQEHSSAIPTDPPPSQQANGASPTEKLDHSTNTIATVLGVKSGSDLVIAASAKLSLVDQMDRFGRKNISEEMQSASSFYRKTYGNNLSKYLDGLVKSDRLRLVAQNTYAVSSKERSALEAKLVGHR
jgi:hypothetical protein